MAGVDSDNALQNCGTTDNLLWLRPSDTNAVISNYISSHPGFIWPLTPDTAVPDLMILIDTETCYPVTGSFHTLYEGEEATLEDLGLMVSYISQTKNDADYYWTTNGSDAVGITSFDKVVVYGRGETVFTVHASGSTNTPMYFIVHSPYVDNGTYYIRNWGTDKYIELTTSNLISGETFSPDSSQLWDITYLGSREYSIRSHQSTSLYLAISGDSTTQNALVVSKTGSLTSGMRWTFTKADSGALRISAQCAPELFIQAAPAGEDSIRQKVPETSGLQYSEWLFCEYSDQIVPEIQEQSMLCWVTCARMASFKYMKSPINQGSAVQFVHGNHRLIPDEVDTMLNHTGMAQHTAEAIEYILGWEGCAYYEMYAVYSENVLVSLLDAGNVVVAERYENPQESGHSYLVYDYWYNSSTGRNEFYIYDPAAECGSPSIIRSYEWLCDGDNAYDSSHKDGREWLAIVTFRIGMYEHTISDS